MNKLFTLLLLLSTCSIFSQITADLENLTLTNETFLNGNDESGGFSSGLIFLPNTYNVSYDYWSGWAISNTTDVTTPGYLNQYSCIAGSGYNSPTYAVSYVFGETRLNMMEFSEAEPLGFYANNNTYAYLSMKDGDGLAKKFGGASGDDPDYFLLTVRNYLNGEISVDSVNFYLADFRSDNNDEDYIVDEWTYVDLSQFTESDSLSFTLSSTDNSTMFGMNTPAYFCIDDFVTTSGIVDFTENIQQADFSIYPNPAKGQITISRGSQGDGDISIIDNMGRLIIQKSISMQDETMDITVLHPGIYHIQIQDSGSLQSKIMIKK